MKGRTPIMQTCEKYAKGRPERIFPDMDNTKKYSALAEDFVCE